MATPQRLSFKMAFIFGLVICLVLFFCAFEIRHYQSTEWDEGVYLATFQSVQNGFPLYQQTYLSQPPGFFISIFPLYSLWGSTVESARMGVFVYSLVGLLGLIWVGWELNSVALSFIAISVLYIMPVYYEQVLTFHADSLPSTFSVLALAAVLRFRNVAKWRWLALSSGFVAFALLMKADVSVLPSIALVVLFTLLNKPQNFTQKLSGAVKSTGLFLIVGAVVALAFTLPYGLSKVWTDVVSLRIQAAAATKADPTLFMSELSLQPQLIGVLIAAVILSGIILFTNKAKRGPLLILVAWVVTTFALLLVYHPLFPHHLTLLAVPIGLLFAFALYTVVDAALNAAKLSRYILILIALLTILMLVGRLNYALNLFDHNQRSLTDSEMTAVNLVNKYTEPGDYIISDDGLVTGYTHRLIPPDAVDTSYERTNFGNLTPAVFASILDTYKPKIILSWAGKIPYLPGFADIMVQHHYVIAVDMGYFNRIYLYTPPISLGGGQAPMGITATNYEK